MVLLGFDDQGANPLDLALDLWFLALSPAGSSPYIQGLAPCGLQSPGRLIQRVQLDDVYYMPRITSLLIHGSLYLRAMSRLLAWAYYKPNRKPSSCILLGFIYVNRHF